MFCGAFRTQDEGGRSILIDGAFINAAASGRFQTAEVHGLSCGELNLGFRVGVAVDERYREDVRVSIALLDEDGLELGFRVDVKGKVSF